MGTSAERRSVAGIWWRQIPHGADPQLAPEPAPSGRWQRGAVVRAVYFADTPETAWAEWYRFLAEVALPPSRAVPVDLWRWRVRINEIADLSSTARLEKVDLPVPVPGRSSWEPFQQCGERLHREGYRGVLAPSAARPGSLVLCLFRDERTVEGAKPVRPPSAYGEPPPPPTGMKT